MARSTNHWGLSLETQVEDSPSKHFAAPGAPWALGRAQEVGPALEGFSPPRRVFTLGNASI